MKMNALFLTLLVTLPGCKTINAIYEEDTGDMPVVAGPPPAADEAGPGAYAADGDVVFSDPSANHPVSLDDPIQPLPEPEPVAVRTYTIKNGDHYWKIAKEVYGDPMRMKDIEAANPGVDPKRLQIGDEILLPE